MKEYPFLERESLQKARRKLTKGLNALERNLEARKKYQRAKLYYKLSKDPAKKAKWRTEIEIQRKEMNKTLAYAKKVGITIPKDRKKLKRKITAYRNLLKANRVLQKRYIRKVHPSAYMKVRIRGKLYHVESHIVADPFEAQRIIQRIYEEAYYNKRVPVNMLYRPYPTYYNRRDLEEEDWIEIDEEPEEYEFGTPE